MQQARQMIRSYTIYAFSAFKDFNTAEIEEVKLIFGIKLGGKAAFLTLLKVQLKVICKLR